MRGIELNPSATYARVMYANYLTTMGRFEESAAISRQTTQLDPLSPIAYNELGFALEFAGRDAEALEQFQTSLDLAPNFESTHLGLANIHAKNGRFEEALRHASRVVELLGATRPPAYLGWLGWIYGKAGQRAEALSILEELRARGEGYVSPSALAHVHLGLGQTEEALRFLRRAHEQRDVMLVWLKEMWIYDPLRSDPRFKELLLGMNFRD